MRRLLAIASAVLSLAALGAPPAAADEACTPRLLVLSAFPGEIDPLLSEASIEETVVADGRAFYVGTLRGNDVVLALSGIGLVNAEKTANTAVDLFACGSGSAIGGIVFSGVSGGRTRIGDVAVPGRWSGDGGTTWYAVDAEMLSVAAGAASGVDLERVVPLGDPACVGHDPDLISTVELAHEPEVIAGGDGRSSDPFGGRAFPCWPAGGDVFGCEPCRAPSHQAPDVEGFVTGTVPFLDPEFFFGFFQNPPATSGADADDMETAAVAKVASERGIPFIAFRALSDGAGDPLMLPGFPFQFFVYRQLAANNAAHTALAFLEAWAGR